MPDEQFADLLAGMRSHDPELTARTLRQHLDGLGHPGVAARFIADGRTLPGRARISGEIRWDDEAAGWTVDDKSGRYMSLQVRPGMDSVAVANWLAHVGEKVVMRLGVPVRPVLIRSDQAVLARHRAAAAGVPSVVPPTAAVAKQPVRRFGCGERLQIVGTRPARGRRVPAGHDELRPLLISAGALAEVAGLRLRADTGVFSATTGLRCVT